MNDLYCFAANWNFQTQTMYLLNGYQQQKKALIEHYNLLLSELMISFFQQVNGIMVCPCNFSHLIVAIKMH